MLIRPVQPSDHESLWSLLEPVIRAGETYTLDRDLSRQAALAYWCGPDKSTFVALLDDKIIGTYYLKQNQEGGGAHVCNCGYVTDLIARGRGVARQMCNHSKAEALKQGFLAMQFNFVVANNVGAIALWQKLGFNIVGTLPRAFNHPQDGFVDAHVMYQWLE